MITINSFSLSIDGLQLSYSANNESNILSFDPSATCALFEDLHILDDFEIDRNSEPVILGEREHDYQDEEGNTVWTMRPVFIHWCDYIKTYPLTQRHAELLAEHFESTKAHRKIIDKINTLLAAPEKEVYA